MKLKLNMWATYRNEEMRRWAHAEGIPIHAIEMTHLPKGEMTVVDIDAMNEITRLVLGEHDPERVRYFTFQPLVMVITAGLPVPMALLSLHKSIAAVVVDGDYESLRQALCSRQLSTNWSEFVLKHCTGWHLENWSQFTYDSLRDVDESDRLHLQSCSACDMRFRAALLELVLQLELISRKTAVMIAGAGIMGAGSVRGMTFSMVDGHTGSIGQAPCPQCGFHHR